MKRIQTFSLGALLAVIVFALAAFNSFSPIRITGKITDAAGKVISDVTISEKNTRNTVQSDGKGDYSITVSNANSKLFFSKLGYAGQELPVSSSGVVNVVMHSTAQELNDVVVLGYAAQKMKRIVGSVHSNHQPVMYGNLYETPHNTESYDFINENKFLSSLQNPLSTFSIDVDAASYSNVRRFLKSGQLPPAGAVRIEEMINYFDYHYKDPEGKHPFAVYTELGECPWNPKHHIVSIGLQGKHMPQENLPAANLVFLVDVSGSMMSPNKLPLVKQSLNLLVDQLREEDRVALVVYAGSAGVALPATSGADKQVIKDAINRLEAGGSTAGGAGVTMAYKIAQENFVMNGNNRVILCTDGDFNIGESSDDAMERLIETKRKSGVFLTVLGYGMGNYKDSKMQKLADKGNGNHAYIDDISEAKKVLVNEFGGTLFTIAKDVKLQVEFNPAKVQGYRLIGYENRMLAKEDFNNDTKDAGEMGSGHTVTALYELIPVGIESSFIGTVDDLKYQQSNTSQLSNYQSNEWLHVKIRYKQPDQDSSILLQQPVSGNVLPLTKTSDNFRFSTSVAAFGMLLRNSEFRQEASFQKVLDIAETASGKDKHGYRKEFAGLVRRAMKKQPDLSYHE